MSGPLQTLEEAGISFAVHRYDAGTGAAALAAVIGLPLSAMLKTIAFASMPAPVLCCVPIDRKVDVDKLIAHLGEGRTMPLNIAALERMTGFKPGAVTPIPSPGGRRFRVVVDEAAAALPRIAIGAGAGVEVVLAPTDLIAACNAEVAAVVA